ncbi:MAG: response regulator transcription factor [Acidobacteria bacterium]|nr:response regulator transcription factor [Acidobacteriota bacterium]
MKSAVGTVGQTIRILLVDDQAIVREGLKLLLESQPGLAVVAEATTCAEAVAATKHSQPDVVLLDLDLGGSIGHDCLTELLNAAPQTRVLVLTGTPDLELHHDAIYKGAMGLVRKLEAAEVLLKAIRKVYAGEVWLDSALMTRLLSDLWRVRNSQLSADGGNNGVALKNSGREVEDVSPSIAYQTTPEEAVKIAQLTDREREVVTLVGEGLRNQQIADRLFISVITVRHHLSSIFSKLDVEDRFELAIYAYRHGLARMPL